MDDAVIVWPHLTYASWRETAATLQLWTQIVGKVRLTLTPWRSRTGSIASMMRRAEKSSDLASSRAILFP
jgi:hypothetical protein